MLNAIVKKKLSLGPVEDKPAEVVPMNVTRKEPTAALPIPEKYLLTIREASVYFNLGVKRLRRLAEENTDTFSLCNGSRYLIIRHKFEQFLEESSSI